ncbi:PqqD family peptide modification chaperone [Halobellus ordinarius]|uniref:PqqD family peptide modification chaperone n=1 Tax=Halobellus ordinarius TaxID=3075120 RepID=UPI002880A3DE|nr:PqqD family peptide modification chaperone [Halobellus sp. ZY16]
MAAIKTHTTVVAKEEHVATTVDGETILLNKEKGTYQGLSGVGPRVWELIQEPTTVGTLVETVSTEYDVAPQRCERDIREFLQEMAAERLIEVDDQSVL